MWSRTSSAGELGAARQPLSTLVAESPFCPFELAADAHPPGSVNFRHTNGKHLPFADGVVDSVCCISVPEHINPPDAIIGEVA